MSEKAHRLLSQFVADGSLSIQNGFPCGNWNDKGVGVLHLRPFNISNGGQIDLGSTKFVETNKKLDSYLLKKGDVIFNNTNSEELVGKTAFWSRDQRSVLSNHMTILRVLEGESLDPQFLAFFLLEKWFERHFEAICRRHVNQASVNTDRLGALELPPFETGEQKKIAHILSTVQRAIETQERIIQTTTELKKALMHKLFTEGLRNEPKKQTEIGPVPESWEVNRFDSFAILQRGFDITKKNQRPGDYPVVSSGGIASYHDEAKVKGPGVVIGRKGSLGTVHYIPSDYWPHDTTLWIRDFKGHNRRFIAYLLETMGLKRFDTGAANPTLNRNIVHGEKVAIPPIDQQVEIGRALEALESKISIHESYRCSFQELFRTLLQELMTAKTRVNELTI